MSLNRIIKIVFFIGFISYNVFANAQKKEFGKLITAIATVESTLNEKAVSKDCVGYLQIRPILVKECNDILKKKKSKKRYTLNDRYSKKKSIEMFYIIQEYFNPSYNIEKALCIWNAGAYSKTKPTKYINKVMKVYNNLK